MKKVYPKPTFIALGLLRDVTKQSLSICTGDCFDD
jgi:hypothetical protein